jgi:hypothetical protein
MTRTLLSARRCGPAWMLALVIIAAVLAVMPDGSGISSVSAAPTKELPADLALVPGNALGFASIRSADWWRLLGIKDVHGQIFRDAPAETRLAAKELDYWPPRIERLTFVLLPGPKQGAEPCLAAIVLTTEAYDPTRIRAYQPAAKEEKINGKSCYVADDKAFYPVDNTIFVVGQRFAVLTIADRAGKKDSGALAPALAAVGQHHVAVGLRPAPLWALADIELPPEAKSLIDLTKPDVAGLTLDFGKEIKGELRLAYSDAQDVEDAAMLVRTAIMLARRGFPIVRKEIEDNKLAPGTMMKVVDELEPALKTAAIETRNKTVSVSLTLKVDQTILKKIAEEAIPILHNAVHRLTIAKNLQQIALAMADMADSNQGVMSAAAIYAKGDKPLLSWRVAILPYIGEDKLYEEFHLDEPWDSDHNKKLLSKMPRIYQSPGAATEETRTHYRVFHGPGAAFEGTKGVQYPGSFTDGTSQTILVVEAEESVPWTKPDELPFDEKKDLPKLGLKDKDYIMVGLADGSTRMVKKTVKKSTLNAAITRGANDILGPDW